MIWSQIVLSHIWSLHQNVFTKTDITTATMDTPRNFQVSTSFGGATLKMFMLWLRFCSTICLFTGWLEFTEWADLDFHSQLKLHNMTKLTFRIYLLTFRMFEIVLDAWHAWRIKCMSSKNSVIIKRIVVDDEFLFKPHSIYIWNIDPKSRIYFMQW